MKMRRALPSSPTSSRCAVTLLRKASRAVARRYETELARAGVTATQMAILRALERDGPLILSRLAEELVLERTSLYRALRPLILRKLVAVGALDRRSKQVALREGGRRKIREALPHWRRAQDRFIQDLGEREWPELAGKLDALLSVISAGR
jgi:DNA-binding MarR family transcriptional regulator